MTTAVSQNQKVHQRFRRVVCTWFDFTLNHGEKSALLQAYPKVAAALLSVVPQVHLQTHQPKGKEGVCERLASEFTQTLTGTQQMRLSEPEELPKHFLDKELQEFLHNVRAACLQLGHEAAFKR